MRSLALLFSEKKNSCLPLHSLWAPKGMADIYELENLDGVRMTWNIWPNSKLEAAKCGIPFSALYTPAKQIANLMVGWNAVRSVSLGEQRTQEQL